MADAPLYRVTFLNRGDVYELYAREVSQGGLFGFVEIGGLEFGKKSDLVIDPSEEKLKKEFEGVERFYLPMHAVVRIDAVAARGKSRIVAGEGDGKVSPFPVPIYSPSGEKS